MIPLRLECFAEDDAQTADAAALEEMRRTARAEGRAEAEAEHAASSDLARLVLAEDVARSLQALSLTWAGAREEVLAGLEPLLRQILGALLPQTAAVALGPLVADAILPLARSATDRPLRLVLHPDDHAAVLPHLPATPVVVEADAAALPGTARILLGAAETRIDPTAATQGILAAVDDLFTLNNELRHG